MLEKILTKVAKVAYPNRDIKVEKEGKHLFLHVRDTTGCNTYLLDGTYSYWDVIKLNELTTYSCGFGYCEELGPVAFIGIPNPVCAKRSGYFYYKVSAYGLPFDYKSNYYFDAYTDEEAKYVKNYTVYGLDGVEEVSKFAPIKLLNSVYDSRHKAKKIDRPRILDMDCKLQGIYSYKEARILATGSIEEKDGYCGEEHPIVFAKVGESYVGIISMWEDNINLVRGFRDVWEYGECEPQTKEITFLSKEEASKIKGYTLYVYEYSSAGKEREKYKIAKYDRTLDNRFNFILPDGSDYRLIEHNEMFVQE